MIYKSDSDGQWYRINPDYTRFEAEQSRKRRKLFNSGIFRVNKDGDEYHLFVKDWSIGCWSPGDGERARRFICAAFSTYCALTRK